MSDVAIIGDIDTVTGFKLGGVKKGIIVNNDEEAKNALDELLNDEISIIIITQKIADNIREHIHKRLGSDVLPMVIEIPDKSGSSEGGADQMAALIKRVIGVEMVKWLMKEILLKLQVLLSSQMGWEELKCMKW